MPALRIVEIIFCDRTIETRGLVRRYSATGFQRWDGEAALLPLTRIVPMRRFKVTTACQLITIGSE